MGKRCLMTAAVAGALTAAQILLSGPGSALLMQLPPAIRAGSTGARRGISNLCMAAGQGSDARDDFDSSSNSDEGSGLGRVSRRQALQFTALSFLGPAIMRGAQSALAAPLASSRLGSPILTSSVLLDLLPVEGRQANQLRLVQTEIEKATILRTLYLRQQTQLEAGGGAKPFPASVWDQVGKVALKALSLLEEGKRDLEPVFRDVDSAEAQIRRAERGEAKYALTRQSLQRLVAAVEKRDTNAVLEAQEGALYQLAAMGELLVPKFPFTVTTDEQYETIPRLLGRATVELSIRKDLTPEAVAAYSKKQGARVPEQPLSQFVGNLTMVVDGFSAPVTAGNFIDLCQRGFYNELPLRFNSTSEMGMGTNGTLPVVIAGSFRDGFVDPLTGSLRRLPLEILRADPKLGNVPFYGAARNTRIFTKAPTVQSFRIPGAVASNHPPGDGNGGSSEFFWLGSGGLDEDGFNMVPDADALNSKYSIFGYIVRDKNQLWKQFSDESGVTYSIEKVYIPYGLDNLVKTSSASFKELLLSQGSKDKDFDE